MYSDASHRTRGGTTSTRPLLRESYRAPGKVLPRPLAPVSQCFAAESEALRLARRHKEDLEHLGPIQDAVTLQQGLACGAVWTVYHGARRLGIEQARGTTRDGQLALGQVSARGIAPGSRLSAGRLARAHAACEVLGLGPCAAAALSDTLAGLAHRQAAVEDTLFAQRTQTQPVSVFVSEVPRRSFEGTPNALAAFGYQRAGTQGQRPLVSGLLCDEAGPPVSLAVFPGHTPEPPTLAAPINTVNARFGVHAITFVGDRGRIPGQHRADLAQQGRHSSTAMTKPPIETVLQHGTWPMDRCAQEVAEGLAAEGLRDVRRRHPVRAQAMRATRHAKLATLQAQGAKPNHDLTDPPRATAQRALQKLVARADKRRLADGVALIVAERAMTLTIKEDARTEAAKRAGCSVLTTDLTPQHAHKALVQDRDTELASVAHACRTCKTAPLEVRPICVRREARPRAHAFVVMLAYQIIP